MCADFYNEFLDDFEFQPDPEPFLEGEAGRRRRRPRPARRPPAARAVTRSLPRPSARSAVFPPRPELLRHAKYPVRRPFRPGWPFLRPPMVVFPDRFGKPIDDGSQKPPKEPNRGEPSPGGDAPDYAAPEAAGSEYIRWVQSTLNTILGLELPMDGMLGSQTRAALITFQRQAGLPPDGILGPETEQALVAYRQRLALPVRELKRFGQPAYRGGMQAELDSVAGQPDLLPYSDAKIRPSGSPTGSCPRRNKMHPGDSYEVEAEAETGREIGLGAASLGVSIFQVIQTLVTSGDLSMQADVARYVHENTPASVPFTKTTVGFKISAFHPRYGIDRQNFYFRLTFEHNRYDLRNVSIGDLRDKSSSLYMSSFSIQFKATPYSQPSDPVAEILYVIQGRWDPAGVGDVSFNGELKVRADGTLRGSITSERGWVRWDGFQPTTRRDRTIALQPTPGIVPSSPSRPYRTAQPVLLADAKPTLRKGARGRAVADLQIRLNRWLVAQGRQPLVVDGVFGTRTKAAVMVFQQAVHLKPDGVVGPKTWGTLIKYY